MSFIPNEKLAEGGIIRQAGNATETQTGDWRSDKPIFVAENCTHCLFCWIFCPDMSVNLDTSGDKAKVTGFDYDHCKGCGICAHHCPPARKGKSAIVMVPEGSAEAGGN
jgi:pyruvate ferredoxin oxidoreductase delta subunit